MPPSDFSLFIDFMRDAQGLLGALFGAEVAFLVGASTRKADDLRQRRELGVAIGRAKMEIAERLVRECGKGYVPSLNVCVLNGVRAADILLDSSLTPEKITYKLADLEVFTKGMIEAEHAQCEDHIPPRK